jgi:hypothetical protein
MIPVLRNCLVYFELSVEPPGPGGGGAARIEDAVQSAMASLSIGLSTQEMPLNTLVGSWKGSVGLCTTGQILDAGRWCSTVDTRKVRRGASAKKMLVCGGSGCERSEHREDARLRRKRVSGGVVGGRPPEPPLLPARSHMPPHPSRCRRGRTRPLPARLYMCSAARAPSPPLGRTFPPP